MECTAKRRPLLSAVMIIIGAAFFVLLLNGWWLDGFALVMAGMVVGQHVGYLAAPHLPVAKGSDLPYVIFPQIFMGIMLTIWLCLPEDQVPIAGFIAKAFDGGVLGYFFVEAIRFAEEMAAANMQAANPDDTPKSGATKSDFRKSAKLGQNPLILQVGNLPHLT